MGVGLKLKSYISEPTVEWLASGVTLMGEVFQKADTARQAHLYLTQACDFYLK
jgi:hypothetical protein